MIKYRGTIFLRGANKTNNQAIKHSKGVSRMSKPPPPTVFSDISGTFSGNYKLI